MITNTTASGSRLTFTTNRRIASKVNKDLFQCRLTYGVVFHLVRAILLGSLQRAEQQGPGDVGLRYAVVQLTVLGAHQDAAGELFFEVLLQQLRVSELAGLLTGHLYLQHEVFAELALQVLQTANALEPAADHDDETIAQCFALVHAAWKTSW